MFSRVFFLKHNLYRNAWFIAEDTMAQDARKPLIYKLIQFQHVLIVIKKQLLSASAVGTDNSWVVLKSQPQELKQDLQDRKGWDVWTMNTDNTRQEREAQCWERGARLIHSLHTLLSWYPWGEKSKDARLQHCQCRNSLLFFFLS